MKNLFAKIFILILFIAQSALVSNAQIITKEDVVPIIEKNIVNDLQEKGFKNIQVNIVSVPFMKLTLPDGKITYKVSNNGANYTSRSFMIVSVYVDGNFIKTVGVPVKISALKDVYVAKETIARGAVLTNNLLQVKTIDISNTFVVPLEAGDLSKSYVTTKIFQAGTVLDKKFLKSQPDIMRDTPVTMYFKSKEDLSITVDGVAISDGNIGDTISVKNKKYNRVYSGKIVGVNKILIRI